MKWQILMLLMAAAAVAGCDRQREDIRAADSENLAAGEKLFAQYCAQCHPRSGRGDYLKRIPVTVLNRRSDTELIGWIRGSERHREMPNFDHFSEKQEKQLATFLLNEVTRHSPVW